MVAKNSQGGTKSLVASFKTRAQTNQDLIVGKWFFESRLGEPEMSDFEKTSFMLFSSNSGFEIHTYLEDTNDESITSQHHNYTYTILGNNQIELTSGSNAQIWLIQSLTQTELIILADGTTLTLLK